MRIIIMRECSARIVTMRRNARQGATIYVIPGARGRYFMMRETWVGTAVACMGVSTTLTHPHTMQTLTQYEARLAHALECQYGAHWYLKGAHPKPLMTT